MTIVINNVNIIYADIENIVYEYFYGLLFEQEQENHVN